jgi:transcriptional regulator with XRE-family HTH domain
MRALREQHKWSQGELGKKMDPPMLQEAVWRIENPNRANLTISTLLRVAAAFDVALEVKFVPFSAIADSAASMSAENQLILSFEDDIGLLEEPACEMVLSAGTDANVARGAGTALPSVAVDTDNSTADAYNLVM